jgi:hypothetical protein
LQAESGSGAMTDSQTYYHGAKADLKVGEGRGRIYIVEPTGFIEDDPNLTNKRFPGNPTRSYRSRNPFRVVGEVQEWTGHTPEQLKAMHEGLGSARKAAPT